LARVDFLRTLRGARALAAVIRASRPVSGKNHATVFLKIVRIIGKFYMDLLPEIRNWQASVKKLQRFVFSAPQSPVAYSVFYGSGLSRFYSGR
jgi:hypothetical protein